MLFGIPARAIMRAETKQATAWKHGDYQTVELTDNVSAIRVHHNAGADAAAKPELALGSARQGRWYMIGEDSIATRGELQERYALPAVLGLGLDGQAIGFTHQDAVVLRAGTIVNLGIAAAMTDPRWVGGRAGGGLQAELVSGPEPTRRDIDAFWSDRWGHA